MAKQKRNPRINVAFLPQQYLLLNRLADLQNTTMSKVVRQFFEHVEPILRDVVAALEAAKEAKGKPAAQLLAAMSQLQARVEDMTDKAVDQGDMFAGQVARVKRKIKRRAVVPPKARVKRVGPVKRGAP